MNTRTAALGIAIALAIATRVDAGSALVDLSEAHLLEQVDPHASAAPGRTVDLLLVEVVRQRIAEHTLEMTDLVPVKALRGDPGPSLAGHDRLPVGELLQLLLLVDSRSAARSLAVAVGPGEEQARVRMRRAAAHLGLRGTTLPDGWPIPAASSRPSPGHKPAAPPSRGRTSAADLVRLATIVCTDGEMRRRLTLDGVPIANGGIIVRATAPLIGVAPPPPPVVTAMERDVAASEAGEPTAALALGTRDGLDVLAAFIGPDAGRGVWDVVAHALDRYERVSIVREGQEIGHSVHVRGGIIPRLSAVAAEPFAMTVRRDRPSSLRLLIQLPPTVDAPVDVDQAIGELVFSQEGRIVGAVALVSPVAIAPRRWLDTARP